MPKPVTIDMTVDVALSRVPHVDQYFGVWAMHEPTFRSTLAAFERLDLSAHLRAHNTPEIAAQITTTSRHQQGYDVVRGGVAIIALAGPLMKHADSFSGGTSTVRARRAVRNAVNDEAVRSIVLHIDSPGGTVAGTDDLAGDVAEAAKQKNVVAYIEDLGASAAYWIASQARKVFASKTAMVGSIGTYAVVYDLSKSAENEGVTVHVIRAGEFKGAGVPGTEVTDEQLAEFQRLVNEHNEFFVDGVAKGRGMTKTQVKEIADGRVHIGRTAQPLGLIDGVRTLDQVIESLQTKSSRSNPSMSQETETVTAGAEIVTRGVSEGPKPATINELKSALPNADSDFLVAQLSSSATLDQATRAYAAHLEAKMAEERDAHSKALEQAKKSGAAGKVGVEGLGNGESSTTSAGGGSASDQFMQLVQAEQSRGIPRYKAIAKVRKQNPDLAEAWIAEHNSEHGRAIA